MNYIGNVLHLKALVILLAILLSSCASVKETPPVAKAEAKSQNLVLTPFQEKIIGHWVTESGRTHYYIGKGTMVMVDDGKAMRQTYEIYETNEAENLIRINVITEFNKGHKKFLKFAPDYKSISETLSIEVMGKVMEVSGKWNYVDAKTSP